LPVNALIELLGLQVRGALEHQVLEEVGEAGAARRVVLGADVVPDLHADRGARVAAHADHLQAVRERALGERDRGDLERRLVGGGQRDGHAHGEREQGSKEDQAHVRGL